MIYIKDYFLKQIGEIERSKPLIYFGAFLGLAHVLIANTFRYLSTIHFSFTKHPARTCWGFFENCNRVYFPSALMVQIGWFVYLILAFLSVYFFMNKKIKQGYFILLFLSIYVWLMVLFDFKNMANFYYMPLIICFLYLLFPSKKSSIPIMISLFYIFAGIVKLYNADWLAGGSIYFPKNWSPYFIFFLTHLVVLLELFIAPLLLLKHSIKYVAFLFFILFHIISYYWVGWFYPVIFFTLLSIFPLLWLTNNSQKNLIKEVFRNKIPKMTLMTFILFITAQIAPRLYYKGDIGVTGEGRTWSLNMYDAKVFCYSHMKIRYKTHEDYFSRKSHWLPVRTGCDPMVYYDDAKKACRWAQKNPNFEGEVSLQLTVKRASDSKWTQLVKVDNFCSKNITYKFLRGNKWINF